MDTQLKILTFLLWDYGSHEFESFMKSQSYDYVLNLAALKHVRSESNVFTMSRMIKVNILDALRCMSLAFEAGAIKYFCVSTDKAANPTNFMGATKRAMELILLRSNPVISVSMARFANVAFSNGSLLEGFENRVKKNQPISAPRDVKRFFMTDAEAGIICLMSCLYGKHSEIFFPNNSEQIKLTAFADVVKNYLHYKGKTPIICNSEEEARSFLLRSTNSIEWPVYLFESDTMGEKQYEEFYTESEMIINDKYEDIAAVQFSSFKSDTEIEYFLKNVSDVNLSSLNARETLIRHFSEFISDFKHNNSVKSLNERM
jgi:FlaA1/EpsC-like NDP-sugar epimerase